ncbi:NUDIX domain-containing protein [Pseudomonas frederiksbergensis]|uniref:GDP-mannose pyrophosphatase n=1 Tax=Pseudomonas frederiksbergensis TaxID=104087 RepID=A0A423JM78_9PSED|nr:NUDIX domain-containing protein [Pseudomonas frederiksbergensis]RON38791.1 GDP-mannose pyrophosphatase [Pseudomonas frederiksbergensis]RON55567.1 GDP-mannose pyrophosphatase [Pseudomonas frederiksbergensis]
MTQHIATKDRVRIQQVEVLSDNWYVLRKTTFDFQGRDGTWRNLSRETYDRGNGATILLYSKLKQTVVLTRQFRFPAFVNDHDGMLIETCAGLLDRDDPHTCIRKETEEETGYRIKDVRKIFEAFMSPGSVTERLYFFVGEYFDEDKLGEGGGLEAEGEEVEVLEMSLDAALGMIETGEINDGKTIMLLQYAKIHRLLE